MFDVDICMSNGLENHVRCYDSCFSTFYFCFVLAILLRIEFVTLKYVANNTIHYKGMQYVIKRDFKLFPFRDI